MAVIAKATKAKRVHRKPVIPKEVKEAENVARQMYNALMEEDAPKATPAGYIMGACSVIKMLYKQAVEQGANPEELKMFVLQYVHKEL